MYLVVQQVELLSVLPMLDIFEWVLANLTLQVLPDVRVDIRGLFTMPLAFKPFLEAADTNPTE